MSTTPHRRVITLHRWLGLLISLQLIVSAAGGLYWATRDHKRNKGIPERKPDPVHISLADVVPLDQLVQGTNGGLVESARLYLRGDRVIWEIRRNGNPAERWDAKTREVAGHVTESEAMAIAERAADWTPARATLIEKDRPAEWVGRPLPVWRVEWDDARHTRAYVDPQTGEIGNSWFTDAEETWAWLFTLHVMDYDGGPLVRNTPLAAFALGVIATAVSGLTLWGFRLIARRRSRKQASA